MCNEMLRAASSLWCGAAFSLLLVGSAQGQAISLADPNARDLATILALKAQWGGQFSGADTWQIGGVWEGITVDDQGYVISLELSGAGLTGGIPTTMKSLQFLQILELRNNKLLGSIAMGILGGLKSLQAILISGNQFTGAIPADIFAPPPLSSLDLSGNQFSGGIPTTIGQATALRALDLSRNLLKGVIPLQLLSCTSLVWLQLDHNQLTGIVPGKIYTMKKLQVIDLSHNNFSGGVPAGFWTMGDLMRLDLSYNQLSGLLPGDMSKLQDLQLLNLAQNFLTGPVPALAGLLRPCSGIDYSCYFTPARVNLSGNYFFGATTTSITVSRRGAAPVAYQLCAQRDLPSQYSVAGNCLNPSTLSSAGAACNATRQRSAAECSGFCGTSTGSGQCGGGGVCVPWLNGPRNRPPFACRCRGGYTYLKGNFTVCV